MEGLASMSAVSLTEVLDHHIAIGLELVSQIKILKAFSQYLKWGYYPFYREAKNDYLLVY